MGPFLKKVLDKAQKSMTVQCFTDLIDIGQVSPKREDVSEAHVLGLVEIAGDVVLAGTHAGHVEHALHPNILHRAMGDHHGARLGVSGGVTCRVPGDVYTKRT